MTPPLPRNFSSVSIGARQLPSGPVQTQTPASNGSTSRVSQVPPVNTAQRVTLETAGAAAGIRTRSGPIDPRDTAELRADLRTGRYTVRVTGGGIRAATLRVAGRRPSAQNDLLQP